MKKLLTTFCLLPSTFCLSLAAPGDPWSVMPQGNSGAVFANATKTNGTVIVSSEYPTGNHWGYWLFDLSPNSQKWLSNGNPPAWAVYQFANGDKWAVTNYTLWSTDMPTRDPKTWRLEGSNNLADKIALLGATPAAVSAATWTAVDERSNPGSLTGTPWTSASFACAANETAYNAYRLNISAYCGGGAGVGLGEWQMQGNSGAAQLWQHAPTDPGNFSANLHGRFDNYFNRNFAFFVLNGAADHGSNLAAWQLLGSVTPVPAPNAGASGPFTIAFSNLLPRAGNFVRILAVDGNAMAWSECVQVAAFDNSLPAVLTLAATDISDNNATANGKILYAPGGAADIYIRWGTDPNNWDHEEFVGAKNDNDAFSWQLAPLATGTEYHCVFVASNAAGRAASPFPVSFITLGGAQFGDTSASVFSDAARIKGELLSPGLAPASVVVSLWTGPNAQSLAPVREWPATSAPAHYAHVLNLVPGATCYHAFLASNTVTAALVWSPVKFFRVANGNLAWDNAAANSAWDNASFNWHPVSVPAASGTDIFQQGDSATFATANASVALSRGMDAERVTFNQNTTLTGGHDLWLLRGLTVADGMTATLSAPRLTGPAGFTLNNATLHLGNPANDFTGPVAVPRGNLAAAITAPASTVIGSGDVTIGSDTPAISGASLNLTSSGATPVANATPGALIANGVYNSGQVNIGNNATARFSGLWQAAPGATMTLNPNMNGTLMLETFNNQQSTFNIQGEEENLKVESSLLIVDSFVLPPWFVIKGFGSLGDYAFCDANGALARATTSELAAAGIASLSGTPGADTNAVSLVATANLDLTGRTVTLDGADNAAGILLRGNLTASATTGGLDLCNNDLYLYNENPQIFNAPVANAKALYKFGTGVPVFETGALPPLIICQESGLEFGGADDFTYTGRIFATGDLAKSGAGHTTLRGKDGLLFTGNCVSIASGSRLTLADGASSLRYPISHTSLYGQLDLTNATLTVNYLAGLNFFNVGSSLNILAGGVATFPNCSIALGNNNAGSVHVTVTDGGKLDLQSGQWLELRSLGASTITVSRKGTLNIQNYLRHANGGAGHTVTINDSACTIGTFDWGYGVQNCHNALFDIQNKSVVTINGTASIGRLGTNNVVRAAGGTLTASIINVASNTDVVPGNALLLAGGQVNVGGTANTTGININNKGVLAVEIQEQGFGNKCGLGELKVTGAGNATFTGDAILRVSAVENAPPGTYRVLTIAGTGAIKTPENIRLQPASPGVWDWWVDDVEKAVYVKYSRPGTLLMVR